MGNPNQRIIVVKRDVLFGDGKNYFEGFRPAEEIDYESRILSNFEIMRRGSTSESANHPEGNAELNPEYKQPIGYTILFNPNLKKVFAYQRSSKDKEYGEKRLQGKWSWGFGGHIEPFDTENGNPIRESMLREVTHEEVEIFGNIQEPKVMGYINDDKDSVGRVHFGILYGLSIDGEQIKPKDPEIARVKLSSLNELEKMCSTFGIQVEDWSKIALEPLSKLL